LREAIGQILPLGIAVALSPLPIVVVVLMLVTERARSNGPSFVLGWVAGLAIVGAVVLAIASPTDASEDGQPATWVAVLKLVLGTLLLLVALRQWRTRPREGEDPPVPKWMRALDGFTAPKALLAAAFLWGLKPKNLLLSVGAALAIAQTGISGGQQAAAYTVFVLIATVGIAAPVVIYFALGTRSAAILGHLKDWMSHNNAVIMAVLCLVIGAKLIGDGVAAL
jgi:hypothetical protein